MGQAWLRPWRNSGSSGETAVEDRHAAAAALREGNMLACVRLGEVTHPAAGTREGFWRRCCLDGDVRDEQELAREGKQEGEGKYVYGV